MMLHSPAYLRYLFAALCGLLPWADTHAQPYQRLHDDFITPKHIWFQQYFDRMVESRTSKVERQIVASYSHNHASALHRRFSNGSVLQDLALEAYLNAVCDSLLVGSDELKHQVRIYPIRNAQPNAFSHGSGTLFVTLGLLANIDSEAALAFVIGHEITHFEQKHAFKQHANDFRNQQLRLMQLNNTSHTKDHHAYSRETESEADSIGMLHLLRSGYSPHDAVGAFAAMVNYPTQYTGLSFHPKWLNNRYEQYDKIPYHATSAIQYRYAPSSTHPDIQTRIQQVQRMAHYSLDPDTATFLQPQAAFVAIQTQARQALTQTLLYDFRVYDALHNAYYHLQQDTAATAQRHAILQALQLLLYARSSKSPTVEYQLNYPTTGEPDAIRQYFNQLTHHELAKRVLYYTADCAERYPNDTLIQRIALSIIDKVILDYQNVYNTIIREHPDIERLKQRLHRSVPHMRYDYHPLRRSLVVAPQVAHYERYDQFQSSFENVNRSDKQYDNLRLHLQGLAPYNIGLLSLESNHRDRSKVLHDIYVLNEWYRQQKLLSILRLPSFNQAEAEAVLRTRGASRVIFVEVSNLKVKGQDLSPSAIFNHASIQVFNLYQHTLVSERNFSYLNRWPDLIPLHIHRSVH